MNYMVVERHPGYAVVLDEAGQFLKVADRQYEIGQMLTEVIPMQVSAKKRTGRWIAGLAAMAACMALVLGMFLPGARQPYASVYVKINPEVRIDVDKRDMVVGIEGINQDGIDLLEGYQFQKKKLELVTDELVDRAVEMGYLVSDGQITISLESQDQIWVEDHTQSISKHLQSHFHGKMPVAVQVHGHHQQDAAQEGSEDHGHQNGQADGDHREEHIQWEETIPEELDDGDHWEDMDGKADEDDWDDHLDDDEPDDEPDDDDHDDDEPDDDDDHDDGEPDDDHHHRKDHDD